MKQKLLVPRRSHVAAATVLTLAASLAAQNPTSLEERVQRLEQAARQERLGVQPTEAAFNTSWVSPDSAGIPDLQDSPKAPGVASTVDLKLWGRVNFASSYDNFQGTGGIGGADFQNFITAEGNEDLNFNPRDTRFGFAASNTWDDWTGRAVFELDFYGSNAGANLLPRMRLAYVELANSDGFSVRAGQDWTPIAQQNPGTLDFGILSWSGNLWNRVPQVTARYKTGDTEALVGVMHHRVATVQDQEERMPWIVGRYAWTGLMEKKGLLALGGGFRKNDLNNGTATSDASSWLVAIEAKVPLGDALAMTAEAWTGAGIGSEFLRSGLDYDSTGEEMSGSGGFVSLEWKATDRISVNAGLGLDQPKDDDTSATTFFGGAVPYDANRTWFANVRYALNKQAGVGFEVMDIETERLAPSGDDGLRLRGQRFTIGTWFIF